MRRGSQRPEQAPMQTPVFPGPPGGGARERQRRGNAGIWVTHRDGPGALVFKTQKECAIWVPRPWFKSRLQPCVRIFSNESALGIRWPKYWSFSFSISLSNGYSGLISFGIDWFDLFSVQGTLKNHQFENTT